MNLNTLDNDFVIRSQDSFNYAVEIRKYYGVIDHVIDWCKENLSGEWRWQMVQPSSLNSPGRYIFYFDSDQDYCVFLLKWKD